MSAQQVEDKKDNVDTKTVLYSAISWEDGNDNSLPIVYWCPIHLLNKYKGELIKKEAGIEEITNGFATEQEVDVWMKLSRGARGVHQNLAAVKIRDDSHFRGLFGINSDPVPSNVVQVYVHDQLCP